MDFISPTMGRLGEEELWDNIKNYLQEDPKAEYKVVIGTDSQTTCRAYSFRNSLSHPSSWKRCSLLFLQMEGKTYT